MSVFPSIQAAKARSLFRRSRVQHVKMSPVVGDHRSPLLPRKLRYSAATTICALLFFARPAPAHPPHERSVGTFRRGDGTALNIVYRRVDGIFFADPVSVQFRFSNGTNAAQTAYVADALLRTSPSGVEVYQYSQAWIPIAGRVERFDGYELKDITAARQGVSLFVHLADHWLAYVAVGGLWLYLVRLKRGLLAMPNRGWRVPLRWAGFGVVFVVGGFVGYDVLVFEPISPLLVVLGALVFMTISGVMRKKRTGGNGSHGMVGHDNQRAPVTR